MSHVRYRQCVLRKELSRSSHVTQVTWLPVKFAVKGKYVKLRRRNGEWEDGWRVELAGQQEQEEDRIPHSQKLVRAHRKRTGDSLPKKKVG